MGRQPELAGLPSGTEWCSWPRCRLNFAETQHPAAPFWTEQAYQRLRRIKASVDPGELIRSNHPIPRAR